MILINKKQVDIDKLAEHLGIRIPLKKILKKPLYEINPALIYKDVANGPAATKHRNSMEFPCYFHAYLKNGKSVEIRYCTNRTPDPKFMGQTEKYSPRVVVFDGKAEFVSDDKDKAVYFWLHFFNKTSPFKKEGVPYEYELVDDEGKANELIELITLRTKATSHAVGLAGDELRITAKGMKIVGTAAMEDITIRAKLMQFASDHPAEYLNKAMSQVNQIEGLIRDSIDKGIFMLENVFNSKRWRWAMGVRKGEVIVEMATSVTDDVQSLITHISQNIQTFWPVLIDTSRTLNAKGNLEAFTESVDVFAELKGQSAPLPPQTVPVVPPIEPVETSDEDDTEFEYQQGGIGNSFEPNDDDFNEDPELLNDGMNDDLDDELEPLVATLPLPKNYKEAQEFLNVKIGKKTPALASELFKGVEAGTITYDNIDMIMAEYKDR